MKTIFFASFGSAPKGRRALKGVICLSMIYDVNSLKFRSFTSNKNLEQIARPAFGKMVSITIPTRADTNICQNPDKVIIYKEYDTHDLVYEEC